MKEHEIRPEALLNRYIELSAQDAERCFGDASRIETACVACGDARSIHQFGKNGFAYAQCAVCGTLFQSPRPSIAAFEAFYRQSESSRYWAEIFYPAVAEIRREKIFRPRVERLADLCAQRGINIERLIDVGAGYGIFLDEWKHRFSQTQLLAIEPSASLAKECRSKGFAVVEDIVENVVGHDNSADLVTCFEVLEHVYAPLDFVRVLTGLARPGGYVFVSALGVDGFDLQVLWEKSSQISPPHHINFPSVQGFEQLFQRAGLVDIIVTTPGQLDVDIVRNAAKREPALLDGQRFLRKLLADDRNASAFQHFLVKQRMSSHIWAIGRKPINQELTS
ncbi:MAG: class I SAM-dependent methyltransferase [Gallionella sp.]|nr:class I SAM-dependent methyltransferase [Gallionella sp.]